jgi:hypothetical protein
VNDEHINRPLSKWLQFLNNFPIFIFSNIGAINGIKPVSTKINLIMLISSYLDMIKPAPVNRPKNIPTVKYIIIQYLSFIHSENAKARQKGFVESPRYGGGGLLNNSTFSRIFQFLLSYHQV